MPFNYKTYLTNPHPTWDTLNQCIAEGLDDFIQAPPGCMALCFANYNTIAVSDARELKTELLNLIAQVRNALDTSNANLLPRKIYGIAIQFDEPGYELPNDATPTAHIIRATADYLQARLQRVAKLSLSRRFTKLSSILGACIGHIGRMMEGDAHGDNFRIMRAQEATALALPRATPEARISRQETYQSTPSN
ncbi:MAG: hypothetical protein K0S29_179 [Gammaproteobacteria bacterium]|jgi:hypothetical protein|nr:hypothetical protein [Gammaproteobacteria bacterium]